MRFGGVPRGALASRSHDPRDLGRALASADPWWLASNGAQACPSPAVSIIVCDSICFRCATNRSTHRATTSSTSRKKKQERRRSLLGWLYSAAAIARIRAAQKARWAKLRKQRKTA